MQHDTKICTKCGVDKKHSDFGKRSNRPSGLRSKCKSCDYAATIEWAKKNIEKRKAIDAASRTKNRDAINKRAKRRLVENPERCKEIAQKTRKKNRKSCRDGQEKWRKNNPDKVTEMRERAKKKNRDATEAKHLSESGWQFMDDNAN